MCEENLLTTFASISHIMIHYREHGNGLVGHYWTMPKINENIFTRESHCFVLRVTLLSVSLSSYCIFRREQLEKARTADPVSQSLLSFRLSIPNFLEVVLSYHKCIITLQLFPT